MAEERQSAIDDKKNENSPDSSPAVRLSTAGRKKSELCRVRLLDGFSYETEVNTRAKGRELFDIVCESLQIIEKDYFGLTYRDHEDARNWLNLDKKISKQIKNAPWVFCFEVKFYPPDPAKLKEDIPLEVYLGKITRYHLYLQIRKDILSRKLPCTFAYHALLASYLVQSEFGDYDPEKHGTNYISEFRFAPKQTPELENKVAELHKKRRGLTAAKSELQYLKYAQKLVKYGNDLHQAEDSDAIHVTLGVCWYGLLVYYTVRMKRFPWTKILKICYKRSIFYIKIRPGEFNQFERTVAYTLHNHRAAKRLWKICVEHHTFFKRKSPPKPRMFLPGFGSRFRYSGRTQYQTRQPSALIDRPPPEFERKLTHKRFTSNSMDAVPGCSGEFTSPDERADESKGHALSVSPTSDENVDVQSLTSVDTIPEEVFRSENMKEVEKKNKQKGEFIPQAPHAFLYESSSDTEDEETLTSELSQNLMDHDTDEKERQIPDNTQTSQGVSSNESASSLFEEISITRLNHQPNERDTIALEINVPDNKKYCMYDNVPGHFTNPFMKSPSVSDKSINVPDENRETPQKINPKPKPKTRLQKIRSFFARLSSCMRKKSNQ